MRLLVTEPTVELAIAVVDGRVDVFGTFDGEADVTIAGSLAALRSLSSGNDALYSGAVKIDGDVATAQALAELVGGLDVDIEEILAPVLGGTLARRARLAGTAAGHWLGRTRSSFRANVEEYLVEEAELLPSAEELERWASDVDESRADADRLEARIARLERRAGGAVASTVVDDVDRADGGAGGESAARTGVGDGQADGGASDTGAGTADGRRGVEDGDGNVDRTAADAAGRADADGR